MLNKGAVGACIAARLGVSSMAFGTCNKCGELRELILAGRVCRGCSDALDRQWDGTPASKWVLIIPAQGRRFYPPSAPTIIETIHRMREREAKDGRASGTTEPKARMLFPPLHWLELVSPDAEVLDPPGSFSRFIFGNATYAEMKAHWALSNPPDEIEIGPPAPEEMAMIEARQVVPPFIRPAKAEEMSHYWAIQRDQQRRDVVNGILEKWGFDHQGEPFPEFTKRGGEQQAAIQAWEEIKWEFKEQGLLEGSLFDYEEEVRAMFPSGDSQTGSQIAVAENASIQSNNADTSKSDGRIASPSNRQVHRTESSLTTGLSQVVGMADLKEQLMHEVIGPFRDPELYRQYRVSFPNGILFYGPPGCGKTYIARSLAGELGWSFQYCRPSDVASPYIHDTVSKIRAVFSVAIEKAPSIIFIDEFEAFVPARSELGGHQQYKAEEVNEFLANLEGCAERSVLVIAATNEPEKIDPAVRRSGRFDKLLFIPPPDPEARSHVGILPERPASRGVARLRRYRRSSRRLFSK